MRHFIISFSCLFIMPNYSQQCKRQHHVEGAQESKEKFRDYHRRGGQVYSSFYNQIMLELQMLDAVTFCAMFQIS